MTRNVFNNYNMVRAMLLRDNAPVGSVNALGGLLNTTFRARPPMGLAGLLGAVSMAPGVGDVLGPVTDAAMYYDKPETRTPGNFALSTLGLLPFVPSVGSIKSLSDEGFDVSRTWFKGMYPYDWTKESGRTGREAFNTDGIIKHGPLIEPRDIKRNSPFPTFGGKDRELKGIRGFFSSSPDVASRFADKQGAVYPVHLKYSNPLVIDAKGKKAGEIQFGASGARFQKAVKSGKYDAIILKNTADEGDVAVLLNGGEVAGKFE